MDDQTILAVDEEGKFLEYISKEKAHSGKGIHHLAITVFIFNSKGQILLQKRKHKLFDNVWDNSGATHQLHLESGTDETDEMATARCLKSEWGIKKVKLKTLGEFNYFAKYGDYCENEHCKLLVGIYDGAITLDPEVGYEYKWLDKNSFLKELRSNPNDFTPWCQKASKLLEKNFFAFHANEQEVLDIVDFKNNVIGQTNRSQIHLKGYFHKAVNLLVFNSKGELFLQQRSEDRWVMPLAWDISASEHVLAGESFEDAAKRGLKEELGVEAEIEKVGDVKLSKRRYDLHSHELIENEFIQTFKATWDKEIKLDPKEIKDGRFFKIKEISQLIKKGKTDFTPWFLEEWKDLDNS